MAVGEQLLKVGGREKKPQFPELLIPFLSISSF